MSDVPPPPSGGPPRGAASEGAAPWPGAAPGPDGAGPQGAPGRSRVGWVLLLVGVLLLGTAGAAIGWQQRQVAGDWRERAIALEDQRDDARGRAEALQRQLDEVAGSLSLSETDVASLEERIRELADEVAQAEDAAATTGVERDVLAALSGAVAGSITSLDGCISELFGLLDETIDAFNRQGQGEFVDVGPLNAQRTAATASCNAARAAAAEASDDAQRLLP